MSLQFAHEILNRAREGWPYSAQTITRCLRVTGDLSYGGRYVKT